jgi:hypothetical protein
VDTGATEDAAGLNAIRSGLATEQAMLGQIPPWPWPADTLRLVIMAILFPLVLWLVRRVLDALFR